MNGKLRLIRKTDRDYVFELNCMAFCWMREKRVDGQSCKTILSRVSKHGVKELVGLIRESPTDKCCAQSVIFLHHSASRSRLVVRGYTP